jgi:GT2 family glycosyltransferase
VNGDAPGQAATASEPRVGVIVIGRNEGERLRQCLASVLGRARRIVYVDSGSTDGSVELAASLGAIVHALDLQRPFTAARARNEGARRLQTCGEELDFIQFVDGDCEVAPGWLGASAFFLRERPEIAAVCGRRRERHPERSVYNLLCDLEWDTPVGATKACGGDVLMRSSAFQEVGGFREDLIAGEEPELCVRLRNNGWLIWRLDLEMTMHDAAMSRFSQWWKRSTRAGFAYAEGARLHGGAPERHWVRESRSAWAWGAVLPGALLAGAILVTPWTLAGAAVYPLQVVRLFLRTPGPPRARLARSAFLVLGKFAEASGQIRFLLQSLTGKRARLIEYK